MNREQQEMALWRESYHFSRSFEQPERARDADAAVAQFRQRYPSQPAAPEAVWYDEPPFAKDGKKHPCWIVELWYPVLVAYFSDGGWNWSHNGLSQRGSWYPLAGRRVCPIHKPQEPPQ